MHRLNKFGLSFVLVNSQGPQGYHCPSVAARYFFSNALSDVRVLPSKRYSCITSSQERIDQYVNCNDKNVVPLVLRPEYSNSRVAALLHSIDISLWRIRLGYVRLASTALCKLHQQSDQRGRGRTWELIGAPSLSLPSAPPRGGFMRSHSAKRLVCVALWLAVRADFGSTKARSAATAPAVRPQ